VARYRRGRVFGASRTDGGVEELPQEAGLALPKVLALQPSDLRRKGGTLRRVSSLPIVPLQKRRYEGLSATLEPSTASTSNYLSGQSRIHWRWHRS